MPEIQQHIDMPANLDFKVAQLRQDNMILAAEK